MEWYTLDDTHGTALKYDPSSCSAALPAQVTNRCNQNPIDHTRVNMAVQPGWQNPKGLPCSHLPAHPKTLAAAALTFR